MELRKAALDDVKILHKLCIDAYSFYFKSHWIKNGFDLYMEKEFGLDRLKSDLQNNSLAYYLIVFENVSIGFIKVNFNLSSEFTTEPSTELEKMYILPLYKGKGIGKLALKELIRIIQSKGKKMLFLCVLDTNLNAIAFYKKTGFKFHSKTSLDVPFFRDELRGMDRMSLEI